MVNHRPGLLIPISSGNNNNPLSEGTYKLYHRYNLTESSEPYEFSVNVRVDDVNGGVASVSHNIVITPRYRVTHYPLSFRLENWCDSSWEKESEFKIRQVIYQDDEQKVENTWGSTDDPVVYPQDYNIGPGPSVRLDGSGWSREITADELIREDWTFMELDLLVDDWIDYFLISGSATQTDRYSEVSEINTTMSGCSITLSIPKESELLVPLPTNDRAVFAPDA